MNAGTVSYFPDLPALAAHLDAFERYARTFYTGEADHDFHLDLKAGHSRNVFGYARALAGTEASFAGDAVLCRALLLAALYHDFGRFRQYDRYGTFNDGRSVNHARLSVREVRRLGLLDGEDPGIRRLTLAGIALHNRFALPPRLDTAARIVANAVRDADKLDIMRIMAGHLAGDGPVDPVIALHAKVSAEVTPAILDAVMERRLGSYADIVTTTDFKLLVCGWLYDLNYGFSRKTAAREGHLDAMLDSLPGTVELRPFVARYRKDLAEYAAA